MSELLGIPKRTIENWESGSRKCPEWAERLVVEKLESIGEERQGDDNEKCWENWFYDNESSADKAKRTHVWELCNLDLNDIEL